MPEEDDARERLLAACRLAADREEVSIVVVYQRLTEMLPMLPFPRVPPPPEKGEQA